MASLSTCMTLKHATDIKASEDTYLQFCWFTLSAPVEHLLQPNQKPLHNWEKIGSCSVTHNPGRTALVRVLPCASGINSR
eukprot:2600544-Amphidinium_carterae.1